jgi:hypothetical protein
MEPALRRSDGTGEGGSLVQEPFRSEEFGDGEAVGRFTTEPHIKRTVLR